MSLEILNNKGSSDLFSSKLLSENDVENGLLSKQKIFKKNTFDEISAFKDSPFGQYWEKRLPPYALSYYGPSRVLNESNFSIIDLSKRFNSALASLYNKSIDENWDDIKFVVYANPDGNEVLKQYADPNFKPEDNQVMFLIETDDGKFDFEKIVRVKLGKNAIEKLKFQYPFLGQTNENDLADEFLDRSFEIKTDSSLEFSEANKERQLNTGKLKNLLVKAIKYDYKQKKFDDMSLFLTLLQGEEFLGLNTPKKILEISQWMRTKKFEEEKFWNALLEKDFTPVFLPSVIAPQNRNNIKESIKNKFKEQIDSISKSNEKDATIEKIFKEILNNVLLYLFDKFSSLLDDGLKALDDILPEGEMLNEIYNLNAFLVGLWNGCIEFVAGIVDLISLVMIVARDGIGFALTDALQEAFESLLNEIVYNFEDFIKKLWEKFRTAIKEFPDWYFKYGSNPYYQYKELGELTPDIVTLLVPAAKAAKASKAVEEISLLKNLSKTEKELAIEKRTQEYLESYYEAFRKESKDFSKKLQEKTAETEVKEAFRNVTKQLETEIPEKKFLIDLYHGTSLEGASAIKENGVLLSKNKIELDFNTRGSGAFYTSTSLKETISYNKYKFKNQNLTSEILHFSIPEKQFLDLKIKRFEGPTKEWEDFVTQARTGKIAHDYDVVIGPKLRNPWAVIDGTETPKASKEIQVAITSEKGAQVLSKFLQKELKQ